jgi:hypothetical protein
MKEREEKRDGAGKEGKLGMKAERNRERKEMEGREKKNRLPKHHQRSIVDTCLSKK